MIGDIGISDWIREQLMKDAFCVDCGTTNHLTIDHIRPKKLGGSNHIKNLQVLCRACNLAKGCHWDFASGHPSPLISIREALALRDGLNAELEERNQWDEWLTDNEVQDLRASPQQRAQERIARIQVKSEKRLRHHRRGLKKRYGG